MLDNHPIADRDEPSLFCYSAGMPLSRVDSGKTTRDADVVHGRFLELVPDRRIVQSVRFESTDLRFAGEMKVTWTLNPAPERTTVVILAHDVPDGITRVDHEAGFAATLDNLAAFVEGRSDGARCTT